MRMRTIVLALVVASSYSGALIPNYASPAEANADFDRRLSEVAKGHISNFSRMCKGSGGCGDWNARGKYALREYAAGLYAFANPSRFSNSDFVKLSGIDGSREEQRRKFLLLFDAFTKTISVNAPVGTEVSNEGGLFESGERDIDDGAQPWFHWEHAPGIMYSGEADFDMALKEIATVVYAFIERPDVLTNEALTRLVSLNTTEPTIPYSGQSTQLSGIRYFAVTAITQPETENHVLMIFQWQFLMNNLVRWIASLDASHPRYNPEIKRYYLLDPQRYQNSDAFCNWMTTVLTRVSRRGLFETNARAYESFSFSAIMNLAANADRLFPKETSAKKVGDAARNAADYLAANYAFMSFKGKRNLSRRRNWKKDYYDAISLYSNDYVSNMMGLLTGAVTYDDASVETGEAHTLSKPYSNLPDRNQAAGFALMSGLSGYVVPDVIVRYALHPGDGWEAASQTRYSRFEYNYNSAVPILGWSFPDWRYPNYSTDGGPEYVSVRNRMMVREDYAVSAGGEPEYFLKQTSPQGLELEELKGYNTITTPIYLIPNGNMGWWGSFSEARMQTMLGSWSANFKYTSNMTTHKSLAVMPASELIMPESWSATEKKLDPSPEIATTGSLQGCPPNICGISAPTPSGTKWKLDFYSWQNGNLLVVGQQTQIDDPSYSGLYSKIGFWDVIPSAVISKFGAETVRNYVISNSASQVAQYGGASGTGGKYSFRYAKPIFGLNGGVGKEEIVIGHGPGYDVTVSAANRKSAFPLLEANELGPDLSYTGRKIVETPELGYTKVCDLTGSLGCLEIDSRDRLNPKTNRVQKRRILFGSKFSPAILDLLLN